MLIRDVGLRSPHIANHCDTLPFPWLIFSEAVNTTGWTKVGKESLHIRVQIICTCFATAKPKQQRHARILYC